MTLATHHFEHLCFQETPTLNSALGAFLIGLAIIIQAAKKIVEEKFADDHPIRAKYLAFCYKWQF